jgi:hypothetical protein
MKTLGVMISATLVIITFMRWTFGVVDFESASMWMLFAIFSMIVFTSSWIDEDTDDEG